MVRWWKSIHLTYPRLFFKVIAIGFPQHDKSEPKPTVKQDVFSILGVTEEELQRICGQIIDNKAPILNGIPH